MVRLPPLRAANLLKKVTWTISLNLTNISLLYFASPHTNNVLSEGRFSNAYRHRHLGRFLSTQGRRNNDRSEDYSDQRHSLLELHGDLRWRVLNVIH